MRIWRIIIGVLLLISVIVWLAVIQTSTNFLKVIVCDVGQGDSILIVYKDIEILTDGGPNNNVIECLGKYLPFWDREIELVILTHPQSDHYFGLTEVFKRYKVDNFLYNDLDSSSGSYQALKKEVGSSGAKTIRPVEGQTIRLGLIHLDILNPDRELLSRQDREKLDPNFFSIVYRLSFGSFSGVFTGDSPPEVNDRIVDGWNFGAVNYIKIPHHGSKNGATENFLKVLEPKVAVISVGAKNSYGHPSPEMIEILKRLNISFYRTDEMGDIVFLSDGKRYWLKK